MRQVLSFPRCPLQRGFTSRDEIAALLQKVVIAIEDGAEGRMSEGETIVVNLHGALIATAIGLRTGRGISIHVYLTDKCAGAGVVYIGSYESAPLRDRTC
jgi:hypothetical protein